ncbi:hypothetical protein MNEG_7580 [Monoraphidium neglectum]|uniref:PAS fold domain-containing protein n=1 Tax=Monoraphidium neglectum TaxID=145388 RepID=A0A0D2N2F2_9CHLO|nr:hypothetical protein MNEG_7580 [Monoraphidium neglectum]KIZ00381.1 hypothetical protein MNEG_7580 [Monoraphidium neglectum]|eukprot:XP_013899400.1 hypothetical protein MNEG_7580 [Monoraphidium neglectum]
MVGESSGGAAADARAPSLRETVARCSQRLTQGPDGLADGTPVTYERALEASSQARVISEPRPPFRVVAVSREFERLSGWRAAEVRGLALAELLQGGAAAPETLRGIRSAAATYERVTLACVHARKDGSAVPARLAVSPLFDGHGHVTHLLGVVTHQQAGGEAAAGACQEQQHTPVVAAAQQVGAHHLTAEQGE